SALLEMMVNWCCGDKTKALEAALVALHQTREWGYEVRFMPYYVMTGLVVLSRVLVDLGRPDLVGCLIAILRSLQPLYHLASTALSQVMSLYD
ncbi:hypothetical protein, partial [Vibrio cholerae]|uniref:hypothetical protein n=1 Tax=Vibrio cholerae TaxID=666 RepID=UPI001F1D54C5